MINQAEKDSIKQKVLSKVWEKYNISSYQRVVLNIIEIMFRVLEETELKKEIKKNDK